MTDFEGARESARQDDGKFGVQPLGATGTVDLAPVGPNWNDPEFVEVVNGALGVDYRQLTESEFEMLNVLLDPKYDHGNFEDAFDAAENSYGSFGGDYAELSDCMDLADRMRNFHETNGDPQFVFGWDGEGSGQAVGGYTIGTYSDKLECYLTNWNDIKYAGGSWNDTGLKAAVGWAADLELSYQNTVARARIAQVVQPGLSALHLPNATGKVSYIQPGALMRTVDQEQVYLQRVNFAGKNESPDIEPVSTSHRVTFRTGNGFHNHVPITYENGASGGSVFSARDDLLATDEAGRLYQLDYSGHVSVMWEKA